MLTSMVAGAVLALSLEAGSSYAVIKADNGLAICTEHLGKSDAKQSAPMFGYAVRMAGRILSVDGVPVSARIRLTSGRTASDGSIEFSDISGGRIMNLGDGAFTADMPRLRQDEMSPQFTLLEVMADGYRPFSLVVERPELCVEVRLAKISSAQKTGN